MTRDSGRAPGPKDSQGTAVDDGLRVAAEFAQAVHMPAASASWLALSVPERGVFGSSNRYRSSDQCVAIGGNPGGANRCGTLPSLNSYANVGTYLDVTVSSWSAGHAKFASKTETLRAPTGDPHAANGCSAAIAEASAVGAPRTAAIALW
jgi:hypothetical protein